jgi:large subunit ribosomal protein L53
MTIPVQTITTFRTAFSPFSPLARPCRLLLNILQNPSTAPTSSATHIDIKVTHLPRNSTKLPEMTIGFKGGKEVRLEVGKRKMKIGDVIDEIARVGRVVEREESLKG